MKKTRLILLCILCSMQGFVYAQTNIFLQYYPISDDPSVGWKSSLVKSETILFEANPTMRFNVFNNFFSGLADGKPHTQAWYVSFRPQIRMYTDNSLPVKTPSYRILLGTQHLYSIPNTDNLFAFSVESGHFSNGQSGGAFTELYDDDSKESNDIYKTITPQSNLSAILNRKSGNFSTNLTEIIGNYRINKLDRNNIPKQTHSLKLGALIYHDNFLGVLNFGGYTADDIKIYGRLRSLAGYEFTRTIKNEMRYSLSLDAELISGAHQSVEPLRLDAKVKLYPFKKVSDFGFFTTLIWGHDNYNYRFVDSGWQYGLGITWNLFPPFPIK
jgi:hypothetical protein